MVFHMGVMIYRNAYRSGPDDFRLAAAAGDLAEGQLERLLNNWKFIGDKTHEKRDSQGSKYEADTSYPALTPLLASNL
jgi:hypothetical protein